MRIIGSTWTKFNYQSSTFKAAPHSRTLFTPANGKSHFSFQWLIIVREGGVRMCLSCDGVNFLFVGLRYSLKTFFGSRSSVTISNFKSKWSRFVMQQLSRLIFMKHHAAVVRNSRWFPDVSWLMGNSKCKLFSISENFCCTSHHHILQ